MSKIFSAGVDPPPEPQTPNPVASAVEGSGPDQISIHALKRHQKRNIAEKLDFLLSTILHIDIKKFSFMFSSFSMNPLTLVHWLL